LEVYIKKFCEFSLVSLGVLLGTGLLAKEFPTLKAATLPGHERIEKFTKKQNDFKGIVSMGFN